MFVGAQEPRRRWRFIFDAVKRRNVAKNPEKQRNLERRLKLEHWIYRPRLVGRWTTCWCRSNYCEQSRNQRVKTWFVCMRDGSRSVNRRRQQRRSSSHQTVEKSSKPRPRRFFVRKFRQTDLHTAGIFNNFFWNTVGIFFLFRRLSLIPKTKHLEPWTF